MKRLRVATDRGSLELLVSRGEFESAAVDFALGLPTGVGPGALAGPVEFAGQRAWFKAGPLAGRARLRHGLARVCAGAPPPRAREALNHHWLMARLFQVPAPLAAGWFGGSFPRLQFLVSAFVEAEPLAQRLGQLPPSDPNRRAWLAELAREAARMHALHFVHRDLYLRNVLVGPTELPRRLWFIDAWRGGERLQLRGPAYDLACLFFEAASLCSAGELREWLGQYAEERSAQGAPMNPERLFAAATRARAALCARARREPGRWRLDLPLRQDFDFAAAAR